MFLIGLHLFTGFIIGRSVFAYGFREGWTFRHILWVTLACCSAVSVGLVLLEFSVGLR